MYLIDDHCVEKTEIHIYILSLSTSFNYIFFQPNQRHLTFNKVKPFYHCIVTYNQTYQTFENRSFLPLLCYDLFLKNGFGGDFVSKLIYRLLHQTHPVNHILFTRFNQDLLLCSFFSYITSIGGQTQMSPDVTGTCALDSQQITHTVTRPLAQVYFR